MSATNQPIAELLDAIERRAEAATEGPWEWHHRVKHQAADTVIGYDGLHGGPEGDDQEILQWRKNGWLQVSPADAEFIEWSRSDVPRLCAALRVLSDALETLPTQTAESDALFCATALDRAQAILSEP